jgi:hypothetical protein
MKNYKHYFISFLFVLTFTLNSQAQSTANATATATILTAISITKTLDMNFGNISVQSATGGTVIMSVLGVRSTTGGVTLPATTGIVTSATFTIEGETNYTYSITLPSAPHTITSSENNMTVTGFVSNPSGSGTLTTGTQTLTIGATLNIAAGQPNGIYTSATGFEVTVNYN